MSHGWCLLFWEAQYIIIGINSKKQQMQWSKPGAHLLLQTCVKTLDGELGTIFKRWYPDMDIEGDEMPAAA